MANLDRVQSGERRALPEIGSEVGVNCGRIAAQPESESHQAEQRRGLCGGENVLNQRPEADAQDIDHGEQDNDDDSGQVGGVQPDIHVAENHRSNAEGGHVRDVPEPVRGGDARKKYAKEFSESHADRGDGSALDDEEERPSVEKTPHGAEGFAQEDILTAGTWHHGGHLAIAERSDEGHDGSDEPGRDEKRRRAHAAADIGRNNEDSGADHGAHDDGRGAEKAKTLDEVRLSHFRLRRGCGLRVCGTDSHV
jgi:hypothetical protein